MTVILLQFVALFVTTSTLAYQEREYPTGFLYHERYGIPELERLKELAQEKENEIQPRIVQGTPAQEGDFPHFAGIYIYLEGGNVSVCGASLISETRLLTAAHCWFDGQHQAYVFEVVLGATSLWEGTLRNTSDVWPHDDWDPKPDSIPNDIAVIGIEAVTYSDTIQNIALPTGSLAKENFVGWDATIVGYGLHNDGGVLDGEHLQYAVVKVAKNGVCRKKYRSFKVTNICVDTSSGKSSCKGDSGGPLQVDNKEDGKPVLIGIDSYGTTTCEGKVPVVFTRVTSYLEWIKEKMD